MTLVLIVLLAWLVLGGLLALAVGRILRAVNPIEEAVVPIAHAPEARRLSSPRRPLPVAVGLDGPG